MGTCSRMRTKGDEPGLSPPSTPSHRLPKPGGSHGAASSSLQMRMPRPCEESHTRSQFLAKREENKKGTEQPSLSRSLANGADAQLSLVFSGPGTLPGISMASPRPCPCWRVSSQSQFLQSNAFQGAPAKTDQAPGRLGLSLTELFLQAQPYWAHRTHTQGWGRGVALLHGKIKPFVREQGPSLGHANV